MTDIYTYQTGELLLRLVIAAILGGMIGFERQKHGRPAGFRTHLIVAVASALLMTLSEQSYIHGAADASVRVDPNRVAAGAITGIGFLGAGVIFRAGATVQGLTTAACLWMVTAVGLAVGAGAYIPSVFATGVTLFALLALRVFERRSVQLVFRTISVATDLGLAHEAIDGVLKQHKMQVNNIDYENDIHTGVAHYTISVSFDSVRSITPVLAELSALEGMRRVAIRS